VRRAVPESIEVVFNTDATWRCEADPGQLQNALLNLVVNARDAMPAGGRLTVETANAHLDQAYAAANADVTPGDYVVVAVSDNGTGMAAAVAERAFDPFFTTKGVGKGTGLGLSMVYGFAKQSLGHAKICSQLGQGTTVRIYLPRIGATSGQAVSPHIESGARGRGEIILVVEDDPDMRNLTAMLLRSNNYGVLEAANAQSALRLLASPRRVALLLTDVVLPGGMNGKELAYEALRRNPGLKVIYMSGYSEDAILHHGRLDPGVHLLQKPFRKRDLAAKVRAILDDVS
jgi:CheY-like chemotaxis protein